MVKGKSAVDFLDLGVGDTIGGNPLFLCVFSVRPHQREQELG